MLIIAVLIVLLGLSLAALNQQRLLNAVILLGVFSLGSSTIYFLVGAPDVAVTEGAIGVAFVTFIYVLALSDQGKLHVVAEEIPPFFYQEKGDLRGIEYEILKGFAQDLNLDLEVEFLGQSGLGGPLTERRGDVIAGAYFQGYSTGSGFSDTYRYHEGQITKITSKDDEENMGILSNMNISDILGGDVEKLTTFDSLEKMIEAYNSGKISGCIADSARMSRVLNQTKSILREQSTITTLNQIEYRFAVPEDERDVKEKLDRYLENMVKTGELREIRGKYLQ